MHIAKILDQLKPGPNTYMAGNFNAHHEWWYAEDAVRNTNIIRNDKRAKTITDWMVLQNMTLANTPTLPTYYPAHSKKDGTSCESAIIDLCFHRGILDKLITNWNVDEDQHGSDHVATSTTWHIKKPEETRTKEWKKANWNEIHNAFQDLSNAPLPWTAEQTLLTASQLD